MCSVTTYHYHFNNNYRWHLSAHVRSDISLETQHGTLEQCNKIENLFSSRD